VNLNLSPRQVEVCCLVAAGASDKEVRETLKISSHTVRHHLEQAAKRIKHGAPQACPPSADPRRVIQGFYVYCYGLAEFQARLRAKKAA
jgi:hypothetical protein